MFLVQWIHCIIIYTGTSVHRCLSRYIFINAPDLNNLLMEASHDIRDSGCQDVGLRIDSHDPEYPIWWLLKASQSGIRIETLYYLDVLDRYADPNF